MKKNLVSLVKRYFPISNKWFFEEVQKTRKAETVQRTETRAVAAKVDALGKSVAGLRASTDAMAACLKGFSTATAASIKMVENKVNNVRGVLDRMEDRQRYIVHMLEEKGGATRLDALRLYFIEVTYKREFSFGSWPKRLHCCVMAESGGHRGWGEACIPLGKNTTEKAIEITARAFEPWRGKSLDEARFLVECRRGRTIDRVLEALDMALVDLSARLKGVSALSYLGAVSKGTPDYAVPALRCILQKDPSKAQELARVQAGSHLKLKLFGDNVHDYTLIKAVREVISKDCFLVGDVNMGYTPIADNEADLVKALSNLREAGLSACEDPADLSWQGLENLQKALPDLAIIPDEPMRPAYKLEKTIKPVSGHIYNLHPNCMGSISSTIALAKRLNAAGAGVMIGDSSLIGPGCAAWQQIACAVKARWCEALEKPEESSAFIDCITRSPMETLPDGRRRIAKNLKGFGLEVDLERLSAASCAIIDL